MKIILVARCDEYARPKCQKNYFWDVIGSKINHITDKSIVQNPYIMGYAEIGNPKVNPRKLRRKNSFQYNQKQKRFMGIVKNNSHGGDILSEGVKSKSKNVYSGG